MSFRSLTTLLTVKVIGKEPRFSYLANMQKLPRPFPTAIPVPTEAVLILTPPTLTTQIKTTRLLLLMPPVKIFRTRILKILLYKSHRSRARLSILHPTKRKSPSAQALDRHSKPGSCHSPQNQILPEQELLKKS